MQVTIPKDDLSALAEALHWEEHRIDNRSSVVFGPRTDYLTVTWDNLSSSTTVEGDIPALTREVSDWVQKEGWKVAQMRATKQKEKKILKRIDKAAPVERCLHLLKASLRPKPKSFWKRFLVWIGG
jgi:hypothetical protein